jgi:hypothetical protein
MTPKRLAMLHHSYYITCMAQGPSGRIVIEVDQPLKRDLYSRLAAEGLSLKDWFIQRAKEYVAERDQPSLPGLSVARGHQEAMFAAEEPRAYKTPTPFQR